MICSRLTFPSPPSTVQNPHSQIPFCVLWTERKKAPILSKYIRSLNLAFLHYLNNVIHKSVPAFWWLEIILSPSTWALHTTLSVLLPWSMHRYHMSFPCVDQQRMIQPFSWCINKLSLSCDCWYWPAPFHGQCACFISWPRSHSGA
jgi:hypothetical protein